MSDNYYAPRDFRISQNPPGNPTPENRPALDELYAAIQQIISTFTDNCGIGQQNPANWSAIATQVQTSTLNTSNLNRIYAELTEIIVAGAICQLYSSGGALKVRNANATNNTKWANAFCTAGGILGAVGEFIVFNGIAEITGLTRGSRYFLSTVDGLVTAVEPVAAGNIGQYIGFALSTTELYVAINGQFIQH